MAENRTAVDEIRRAAAEFERALNSAPYQLDVTVEKIDVTTIGGAASRHAFAVRVVLTRPVQVFP